MSGRRATSEKSLQAQIVQAFLALGFDVTVFGTVRRASICPRCHHRVAGHMGTQQTAGVGDLYVRYAHAGRTARVWVEVKTPTGVCSADQRAWHDRERAAGGEVVVVRSVDQVIQIAQAWGVPVRVSA